jgi:FkbM family methyltransferase
MREAMIAAVANSNAESDDRPRYNLRKVSFSYSETQIAELVAEFTDPKARESVELAALPEILSGADFFIDAGANVGQYIFHASNHLRHAKLLAIEANPYLIAPLTRIVEDVRAADTAGNQYEICGAAVSDIAGNFEFFVSRFPTLSSVFPHDATEKVQVPSVRLDDFYRPDMHTVVKIDVEGAEYRAVRSAAKFLHSNHASFFIELHGWGDKTIGKYPIHLCWLFFRNGYASRKIGTHYWFYRAPWLTRAMLFLRQSPYLAIKYAVFRFLPGLPPALNRLRNKLKRSV